VAEYLQHVECWTWHTYLQRTTLRLTSSRNSHSTPLRPIAISCVLGDDVFSSLRYRCQTTGKFVVTGTCWHQTRSANRCLRSRLRCRPGTQRCRALLSSRRQLYRTISDVTTTTRQCVIILTASSWFHRRRVVAWQLRVNSDCGRLDVARSASLVATAVAAAAIAAADCEAF